MKVSDYRALFASEAEESLRALEIGVISLEQSDDTVECINELFRHAHNLKGISGAMGYELVVEASHSLENALDRYRKEELDVTPGDADLLLRAVDILRELVGMALAESKKGDGASLVREVVETMALVRGEAIPKAEAVEDEGASGNDAVLEHVENYRPAINSTKVELERLDKLMDLVGELIISRIRLRGLAKDSGSKPIMDELSASGRLISEIQKEVMEIRLVPVGQIFERFKRLVRDIGREMGKKVKLNIYGADIGLDRTVLEGMVDPLVHLIRNSLDHGIEAPEERERKGKPAQAEIFLSAKRDRNFVVLEVSDDGRGIDMERIMDEKRRGSNGGGEDITEEELCRIITAPGFSTSSNVDRFSGRGMGMNIVKKAVDSFGGTLTVHSEKDSGTTVSMRLPINLSINKALLFQIGDDVHAIPIEYVKETIRVEWSSFQDIKGRPVLQTKYGTIPVVHPMELFGIEREDGGVRFTKVIVVETGSGYVGLIVNNIIGQQDIVIKGLPAMIRGIGGISGAAILGSGRIAFIWDTKVLVQGRCMHESN